MFLPPRGRPPGPRLTCPAAAADAEDDDGDGSKLAEVKCVRSVSVAGGLAAFSSICTVPSR